MCIRTTLLRSLESSEGRSLQHQVLEHFDSGNGQSWTCKRSIKISWVPLQGATCTAQILKLGVRLNYKDAFPVYPKRDNFYGAIQGTGPHQVLEN